MQNNSEPTQTALASMRVVYDVLGRRLPFSFMSELQVSLALENSTARKHTSVLDSAVDRVAGSVLQLSYICGGGTVTEWVVVSQGTRSCNVSTAERDMMQNSASPDAIRVMECVELNTTSNRGSKGWRLLKRVTLDVECAEDGVPGLSLRRHVAYVNAQGTCAIPEQTMGTGMAGTFVNFGFEDGFEEDVEQSTVLPLEEIKTILGQQQMVRAWAQSAAQGGAEKERAVDRARNRVDAIFNVYLVHSCGWQ